VIRSSVATLANGLRVVCVEMPHLHSAELAVYLMVGSRNDPPERGGLSHFLEHILFRGSREFPSSLEIEKAFEAVGGAPNAATDAESTCFYSRIHPSHVRRGMEIFSSMLLRPLLEGVEVEQRIIAEEAREDLNEQGEEINPDTVTSSLLWPRHPLGRPTVGTLESIAAITRDDLADHHRRFYVPAAAVLVVVGPVRHEQVFADAADLFGGWAGAAPPPTLLVQKRHHRPATRFVRDSDSQVKLQIAFLGFPRGDRRYMAVRLLRRILAGGGSSRLHLRLREQMGVIYSVEGSIGTYEETGCIAFDFSTAPRTLVPAVTAALEELADIAHRPVPLAELESARQAYRFDLDYSRDSAYEMGVRYGWGELVGIRRSIEQDQQELGGVSPGELCATARELLAPENLRLVAIGPCSGGVQRQVRLLVGNYALQWGAAQP